MITDAWAAYLVQLCTTAALESGALCVDARVAARHVVAADYRRQAERNDLAAGMADTAEMRRHSQQEAERCRVIVRELQAEIAACEAGDTPCP